MAKEVAAAGGVGGVHSFLDLKIWRFATPAVFNLTGGGMVNLQRYIAAIDGNPEWLAERLPHMQRAKAAKANESRV